MRPLSFLVVLVAVLIASGWQYRAELGLFGEGRQPVGVHGAMGAGERPVGSAAAAEVWLRTSVTGVDHARCAASSARFPRPPDVCRRSRRAGPASAPTTAASPCSVSRPANGA